jgi:hypothetical protein
MSEWIVKDGSNRYVSTFGKTDGEWNYEWTTAQNLAWRWDDRNAAVGAARAVGGTVVKLVGCKACKGSGRLPAEFPDGSIFGTAPCPACKGE